MDEVDRKAYPKDVTDEAWAFVLPYLLLSREDSQSWRHSLRELFNGVRYIVRTGHTVDLAYVDQGYTGPNAAEAAQQHGIRLEVVKHPMAK